MKDTGIKLNADAPAIERVVVSDVKALCLAAERRSAEILVCDKCVKFVRDLDIEKSVLFDVALASGFGVAEIMAGTAVATAGTAGAVGVAHGLGAATFTLAGSAIGVAALPVTVTAIAAAGSIFGGYRLFAKHREEKCKELLEPYRILADNGDSILLRLEDDGAQPSNLTTNGDVNIEAAKSEENVVQPEITQPAPAMVKALPDVGDVVGDHRIVKRISRGGMAVVFEVEHVGLKMRRAMKFFDPRRAKDAEEINRLKERFNIEARLLNDASQRVGADVRMTRVYDFKPDPADMPPYYVMDLVVGPNDKPCSLRQAKEDGLLTVETLEDCFADVCATLGALHGNGIIHRDLKPDNILLDKERHAVIVDLGTARDVVKSDDDSSRFSIVTPFQQEQLGTKQYWAPELEKGKDATIESDVYAVGATFYELIFGDSFSIDQYPLKMDAFLDAFDDDAEAAAKWHERLLRMLSPNPQDRPHAVAECLRYGKPAKRSWFVRHWFLITGGALLSVIAVQVLTLARSTPAPDNEPKNRILRYKSDDGKIVVKYINNARLVVDQYYTDFVVIENGVRKRYECPMTDCGSCGNCVYRSDDGEFEFEDSSWGYSKSEETEIPIYVRLGSGESARSIHLNQVEDGDVLSVYDKEDNDE